MPFFSPFTFPESFISFLESELQATVIVINVKKDGSYKMGDKAMKLDQIRIKLREEVQRNPDQKVLVRGDGEALHKDVAAAVAAAIRARRQCRDRPRYRYYFDSL